MKPSPARAGSAERGRPVRTQYTVAAAVMIKIKMKREGGGDRTRRRGRSNIAGPGGGLLSCPAKCPCFTVPSACPAHKSISAPGGRLPLPSAWHRLHDLGPETEISRSKEKACLLSGLPPAEFCDTGNGATCCAAGAHRLLLPGPCLHPPCEPHEPW